MEGDPTVTPHPELRAPPIYPSDQVLLSNGLGTCTELRQTIKELYATREIQSQKRSMQMMSGHIYKEPTNIPQDLDFVRSTGDSDRQISSH